MVNLNPSDEPRWLGLMIGNSRLHWAWFTGSTLQQTWDTAHLSVSVVKQLTQQQHWDISSMEVLPPSLIAQLENSKRTLSQIALYLASVVPAQTELWQAFPSVRLITLDTIPLQGTYPTLGIDRALALWGAGVTWGWPMLVIDAGTALTFTGADTNQQLVGGAILPGLGLQLRSLGQGTAGLPSVELPLSPPPRWALTTPASIQSGVVYTVLAGVRDFIQEWWRLFPGSKIAITGGDRTSLHSYLQAQYPALAATAIVDPYLIFWGMRAWRSLNEE